MVLGREKRIPYRSSNPACDNSPLASSNSEESVMCRPALILPQNEIYKDIGINKNIYTWRKKGANIERQEEWNINKGGFLYFVDRTSRNDSW